MQFKLAQYQAYALANQTAPKTRQIVMLYDGAIRNLRQAKDALEGKRIEERYHLLVKASDIILGLQGCLDFDQGGEIAKLLYDFYSSVDARILALHRTQSIPACEAIIKELKQMRDAWSGIDQQVEQAALERAPQGSSPASPSSGSAIAPTVEETPQPMGGVEISA